MGRPWDEEPAWMGHVPTGHSPSVGRPAFAVLVIWKGGEREYLKEGEQGGEPARFANRKSAKEMRDFMLVGMSEDVQSVNVVPYPAPQGEARP